jgi:toxin ParE1/3/4
MGWEVTFSPRSRQDLQRIAEFIARDNPAAAERFGLALIERAESLSDAPEIGIAMPERPGTRFLPHGSYLIIYRPSAAQKTVRILRFWHGARAKRPLR